VTWRFDSIVAATRLSVRARVLILVLASVAVVLIGAADYAAGVALSLSVFYFIPVAVATIGVSRRAGVALSAAAAVAWTVADTIKIDASAATDVSNALFRFGALTFVVVLLAALRRALREAQASERRSKEFLAYAAHQLRTPLAGLRASAEALVLTGAAASPDERERVASNLMIEADRIGRLVRSLLRLARLDAGDDLQRLPCNPEALVEAELQRAEILAPGIDFRHTLPPEPAGALLLDPTAVSEIVANLLDNARRHATGRVEVSLERSPAALRIFVRDDGPGLPAGAEHRAFDRFVSMDGRGGSGLGLSICRSLAEAHGGTVDYRDRASVVVLPALAVDAEARRTAEPGVPAGHRPGSG
jgi:signal transduction histidine kinase